MEFLYKRYAKYYDLVYKEKDYSKETLFIEQLLKKNRITGRDVLEIGCGTGGHAALLSRHGFNMTGADLNKEMLAVAKKKVKAAKFVQADMRNFNLKKEFDIILCLFSTIHYTKDYKTLEKTLKNFHKHLKKGGMLVFDMGFNNERWTEGHTHFQHNSDKQVDIVRFSKSTRKGNIGTLHMAYILYNDGKFGFGSEEHQMGIFKTLQVKKIAERIGFSVEIYDSYTLNLWKPASNHYVVFSCIKR